MNILKSRLFGAYIKLLSVFMIVNINISFINPLYADDSPKDQEASSASSLSSVTEASSSETEKSAERYEPKQPKPLPTVEGEVLWIPIQGTIDLGLPPFIERALDSHPRAKTIILEVDTLGGRVDAAIQIRDRLLKERRPVIAFVYRRAISAGALISFAADYLIFSNGATMGAATPIQLDQGQAKAVGEKMVSYFRSEMRSTAEAKNRDGKIAEAMVDADIFIPTVSPEGKLLTLTTEDAVGFGIADGQADSPEELQQLLGYQDHLVVKEDTSWSEDIARAVTDPTVSGLLMSLGMLGIMIELYTPGIGIAGILGVVSLFTFFFGHKVAGLAGSGELILILLGLLLLALEVFVIPGFGVAGITGILFLAAGFITSMGEMPEGGGWDFGVFETPVQTFVYALLCTVVLAIVLAKYLPYTPLGSWLILRSSLSDRTEDEHQYEIDGSTLSHQVKVGDLGTTTTPLRMSGKAEINGQVIDVISRDEYLEPKQDVKIVEISGSRIVVVAS